MFHKFINRYIIKGKLVAATALHIGASEDVFRPGGCKNPFFRNADGLPLIPGSSLKGAMRSFLEQYLSSESGKNMIPQNIHYRRDVCNEQNPCANPKTDGLLKKILKERGENAQRSLPEYLFGSARGTEGNLCIICRLFGSPYSAAKFSIRDAGVIEDTFQNAFEIRSGVSIDRDFGTGVDGIKFETEVVPRGTAFSFYAVLENGDGTEWYIIQQLLQAMKIGLVTIGGMKSRGLGEIRLTEIEYQEINGSNIADYLSGNDIEFENFIKPEKG